MCVAVEAVIRMIEYDACRREGTKRLDIGDHLPAGSIDSGSRTRTRDADVVARTLLDNLPHWPLRDKQASMFTS